MEEISQIYRILIVNTIFIITVLVVLYRKLRWFNVKDVKEWISNSKSVVAVVERVLLPTSNYIFITKPVILQIKYQVGNKNIRTYVGDRDLSDIKWTKGDTLIIQYLRSDPKQCHYKKFAEDNNHSNLYKYVVCTSMALIIFNFYLTYIIMIQTEMNVLVFSLLLFISIIIVLMIGEVISSFLEKYQRCYDDIVNKIAMEVFR